MSDSFRRCRYIDQSSIECEVWFSSETVRALAELGSEQQYYCPLHRDAVGSSFAANGLNKESYIERRKAEEAFCFQMSLDELEAHIAKIEQVIEAEKLKVLTARAVKSQKLENLSDDEREQRRKIKTPRIASESKKKSAPKATLASNPLKYMMEKNGLSKENAISMLGLTPEEVRMYESI